MARLPFTIEDIIYILKLTPKRGLTGWAKFHCPYHYKGKRGAEFYVNIEEDRWKCFKSCPSCPSQESGGTHKLKLYALFTGVHDRVEAIKQIKSAMGIEDIAKTIKKRKAEANKQHVHIESSNLLQINERHRTYSAFLDSLRLSPSHIAGLKKRGLNEVQIKALGYKSMPVGGRYTIAKNLTAQGFITQGVPGFYTGKSGQPLANIYKSSGFLIPVRDVYGRIQCCEYRVDDPSADELEKMRAEGIEPERYLAFSSSSCDNGTKVPGVPHYVGFVRGIIPEAVGITEGSLKADVSHCLSGSPFVAIVGVGKYEAFTLAVQQLKKLGVKKLFDCFDMDRFTKESVMLNITELYKIAESEGLPLTPFEWDHSEKGIDDYLKQRKENREGQIA